MQPELWFGLFRKESTSPVIHEAVSAPEAGSAVCRLCGAGAGDLEHWGWATHGDTGASGCQWKLSCMNQFNYAQERFSL